MDKMLSYMGCVVAMGPSSETSESSLIKTVVVDIREFPRSVFLRGVLLFKPLRVTLSLEKGGLEWVVGGRAVKSIEQLFVSGHELVLRLGFDFTSSKVISYFTRRILLMLAWTAAIS